MINDARARPRADDATEDTGVTGVDGSGAPDEDFSSIGRRSPSVLVARALAVLLVLLLAGMGYLWVTRPATSSIRVADYVGALEGARSGVIDLTSFDYLTLDDNLRQIKAVTTGDLQTQSLKALTDRRKDITDAQAVVNTKISDGGAGVTKASGTSATVVLVIETTQKTKASTQATVTRFRIEVQMKKLNGRWLLSGITGR